MNEEKKIRPQDRWDAKAGVVTKGYKLHKAIADEFAETCKAQGVAYGPTLEKLMLQYISEHKQ